MLKPPKPDPALDPFRGGVAVLRRDGEVAGHLATEVKTFWAPFSFSRHRQWWVWFIVVWTNGDREPSGEDYPPWTVVREMLAGAFSWDEEDVHQGDYAVEWLPQEVARKTRSRLKIEAEDF